jgi:hypothetical protein
MVIDTGDGLLLKPRVPFAATKLEDVYGMFNGKVTPKADEEIKTALLKDIQRKWRDSN